MNRIFLSFFLFLCCLPSFAQPGYIPTTENLEARQTFINDRLGIFVHWGLYSMLGDGEWVQYNQKIDNCRYERLANCFYPSKFDAEEWIRAFKDAGAGYVTFTSRHHEGFSMFKTAQSDYNIVDGTPFGRDVIAELSAACQKYDFRLHLYYSHLDWHREDYWPRGSRSVNYPLGRKDGDEHSWRHYEEFMLAQLTELLTNYGPIGCIWFDGLWDKTTVYTENGKTRCRDCGPREFNIYEQYELIHRLQPACLVANNHHVFPYEGEDIEIFERDLPGAANAVYSKGQGVADGMPLEICTTMNKDWGYNINSKDFKSVDDILTLLVKTAAKDVNLLINVGPRADGSLPDESLEILKGMGVWMRRYGNESVKGTRGGFAPEEDWGVQTRKGNVIYLHILKPVEQLTLPYGKVASVTTFDGEKIKFKKTRESVSFIVPERQEGEFDQIIKLTLK